MVSSRTITKKVKPKEVVVIHSCTQENTLNQLIKTTDKLSTIITGNGTPEEGFVFKVIEQGKDIKYIKENLTGISGIVKELHEKSIGENAIEKKNTLTWEKGLKIVGMVIALGMLLIGYLNLTRQNKAVEKKVDDMSIPFVTNSRGEILALPDSTRIMYYPYADSLTYTIKKDKPKEDKK